MNVQDIKLASEFFKGTDDVLLSEDAEFRARTEITSCRRKDHSPG